jgi:hypothetical protein
LFGLYQYCGNLGKNCGNLGKKRGNLGKNIKIAKSGEKVDIKSAEIWEKRGNMATFHMRNSGNLSIFLNLRKCGKMLRSGIVVFSRNFGFHLLNSGPVTSRIDQIV